MTIKNKFSLIGITALLICFAVIFFGKNKRDDRVLLRAEPVQTVYGWGYNIYAGDRLYIKQEFIPSLPGKNGFRSSADALRVANLIIERLTHHLQPTINNRDLDSLGISLK